MDGIAVFKGFFSFFFDTSEAPHFRQNFASSFTSAPQEGQARTSCFIFSSSKRVPQFMQNFASGAALFPHTGQILFLAAICFISRTGLTDFRIGTMIENEIENISEFLIIRIYLIGHKSSFQRDEILIRIRPDFSDIRKA